MEKIKQICDEVIAANPASVQDYRNGYKMAINSLIGQVVKLGKRQITELTPELAKEILTSKLSRK